MMRLWNSRDGPVGGGGYEEWEDLSEPSHKAGPSHPKGSVALRSVECERAPSAAWGRRAFLPSFLSCVSTRLFLKIGG